MLKTPTRDIPRSWKVEEDCHDFERAPFSWVRLCNTTIYAACKESIVRLSIRGNDKMEVIMIPIRAPLSVIARIFLLALLSSLISCNVTGENTQMSKDSEFQLAVLDERIKIFPKGLGQDWQTAWPVLQAAYPSNVAYTISARDIDSYDWSEQIITLNTQASVAILDKFYVTDTHCENNQNKKTCLLSRAFVVVYQGAPLYGGIFLADQPMAARFQYPIIYPMLTANEHIAFIIRPYTSITKTYGADDWLLIKDERIEALFAGLGKLTK